MPYMTDAPDRKKSALVNTGVQITEEEIRVYSSEGALFWRPHFESIQDEKAYQAFVRKIADIAAQEISDHYESQ